MPSTRRSDDESARAPSSRLAKAVGCMRLIIRQRLAAITPYVVRHCRRRGDWPTLAATTDAGHPAGG
jgi:hypothetical protein